MIMTGAMDVDILSFTPEQLNLKHRRLPEERVSSVVRSASNTWGWELV